MIGDGTVRALADLFARFGRGAAVAAPAPAAPPTGELVIPTKAFRTFLACLARAETPVLMDLGPVVGANVSFFGERLRCKILVEDLYEDLERCARQNRLAVLPEFLKTRFSRPDASVDGILSWDILDYLDRPAAAVLARELTRLLRPGGALLGLFATADGAGGPGFSKFAVVDEFHLRSRPCPGSPRKQRAWLTRDIIKMFEGLLVSESFLLTVNTREMLFRKPMAAPTSP